MSDEANDEPIEAEVTIVTGNALAQVTKAETDIQISTAKKYPRNIDRFVDAAASMACLDVETAESCWYEVPREGGTVSGPSIGPSKSLSI